MDNNNDKPAETPNTNGQVMDIEPPKPVTEVPVTDASDTLASSDNSTSDSSVITPTTTAADSDAGTPADRPTTEEVQPQSNPTENSGPTNPNPMAIPPAPVHKKSGAPKAAIVVAIVIALALAGLTVFAYLKTQNGADSKTPSTSTDSSQKATTDDVDQATKAIDDSANSTNDTTDFPANELSDQSLNL